MFFSSSSLSEDGTISDYSEEETSLRVCMAKMAKTKVFLCDETKFQKTSAFNLFTLSDIDYVVTGAPLPDAIVKKHGLQIVSDDEAFMYKR
jgi:DeoR family glycerol-3-phosphate regulon repressor